MADAGASVVEPAAIALRPARLPARLPVLDELRGLMAVSVAIYHLNVWTQALQGRARDLSVVLGIYSVQGFFLLSGLCFFALYGRTRFDRGALGDFYLRRYLRIAPLLYVAIALSYAGGHPVNPGAGLARFAENASLSFGLFHPNHALVLGGWSIGIECVFYAAFPVLVRLTQRRLWLYVGCALCCLFALPYSFGIVESLSGAAQFNAYVQVPNHAFLFLLGGVIADVRERVSLRLPAALIVLTVLMLGYGVMLQQPEIIDHASVMVRWPRVKYLTVCAAMVLLCSLCRDPQPSAAGKVLRWLGDLSYSVYLMHPIAWLAVSRFLPPATAPLMQLGVGLCASLVLASCTEHWIERPAIRLGKRWTSRDRAPQAAPELGTARSVAPWSSRSNPS